MVALVLSFMAMPTRLKVGVGPDDREHARVIAAFARKLQDDRAPVRLTLVRKQSFASWRARSTPARSTWPWCAATSCRARG